MASDEKRKDEVVPAAEQRGPSESGDRPIGGHMPIVEDLDTLDVLLKGFLRYHNGEYEEVKRIVKNIKVQYIAEQVRHHRLFEKYHDEVVRLKEERKRDQRTGFLRMPEFLVQASRRKWNRRSRYRVVMFLDIAGFSAYNNVLGHSETDRVALIMANVLSNAMRPEDLIARYEDKGDEFVVLLDVSQELNYEQIKSLGFARTVVNKLQKAASDIDWEKVEIQLTPAMLQYVKEHRLFPTDGVSEDVPFHLPLAKKTVAFLREHPIGLDAAVLLADIGRPGQQEEESRTPEERKQIIADLLQAANLELMKIKPEGKKPRRGLMTLAECKVVGTKVQPCKVRRART